METTDIRAMVRAQDPATSVIAAESALKFLGPHRERILKVLRPDEGLTAHEIGTRAGLTVVQVDRRMTELQRLGQARVLAINGIDVTRDGFRVWVATPE